MEKIPGSPSGVMRVGIILFYFTINERDTERKIFHNFSAVIYIVTTETEHGTLEPQV